MPRSEELVAEMNSKLDKSVGLTIKLLHESHKKLNKQLPENHNSANLLPYQILEASLQERLPTVNRSR